MVDHYSKTEAVARERSELSDGRNNEGNSIFNNNIALIM